MDFESVFFSCLWIKGLLPKPLGVQGFLPIMKMVLFFSKVDIVKRNNCKKSSQKIAFFMLYCFLLYDFPQLIWIFWLKITFTVTNKPTVTTNGTLSRSLWSPLTACCRSRTWSSFWKRKGSSSRPTATRRRSRRRRTGRRPQTSPTTRPRRAGNRKNKRFGRLKR